VPLAFALAARLPYFLGSDFPLNDGGMFVAMSRDILASHFALPDVTTYNFEGVPFAYPPVAFYVVAALSATTAAGPVTLAMWLPLLANLGTVACVVALARRLLDRRTALIGGVIFALIPRSYEWLIMGGGLTRSFGLLFAVACLVVAAPLFQARPRLSGPATLWRMAACAVLAALTFATHLELALFVGYSLCLLAVCYGRDLRSIALTALIGAAAIALAAPWWGTVIARQGLAPFAAASHTGDWSSLIDELRSLEDFMTPPKLLLSLPGALAVLGVVACAIRVRPFLPVWLVLIFVLNPRSAATEAAIPVALLAAVGVTEIVEPGLAVAWTRARESAIPIRRRLRRLAPAVAAVALVGVFVSWPTLHPNRHALDVLSTADRQAMEWVSQQTPSTDTFLVLTRGWTWEDDHVSEWFPVLAGRQSALTVQAREWLPDNLFVRTQCLYNQARQLGAVQAGVDRLDQWATNRGVVFSDVYISRSVVGPLDWGALVESARSSTTYRVAYDQAGVIVLERREATRPRWPASGELMVADDCTSLGEQSDETQQAFQALYGPDAARAWVSAHNADIKPSSALADRVRRMLIGTSS
jgi:hypothetical protein